jgi:hypothetical protein
MDAGVRRLPAQREGQAPPREAAAEAGAGAEAEAEADASGSG